MRTYDKLIATIPARRSTRPVRSCFGLGVAACASLIAMHAPASPISG
jgi:hypothetical protein